MRLRNEPSMIRALEIFIWIACTYFSTSYLFNLWEM